MYRLLPLFMSTVTCFACFRPFFAQAASFDCTKARAAVERTICGNAQLSELDSLLNDVYKQALSKSQDINTLKMQQRAWLRDIRGQCKDATCLLNAYTERLTMLSGVCNFFGKVRAATREELKKLNVEHYIGELCDPSRAYCGKPSITLVTLGEMGLQPDDEVLKDLLREEWIVRVALVDIDNDGTEDLRLHTTVGTGHCTYSYIFIKTPEGKFKSVLHSGYDVLHEEARFCECYGCCTG